MSKTLFARIVSEIGKATQEANAQRQELALVCDTYYGSDETPEERTAFCAPEPGEFWPVALCAFLLEDTYDTNASYELRHEVRWGGEAPVFELLWSVGARQVMVRTLRAFGDIAANESAFVERGEVVVPDRSE